MVSSAVSALIINSVPNPKNGSQKEFKLDQLVLG
jgi:hypothetical protein